MLFQLLEQRGSVLNLTEMQFKRSIFNALVTLLVGNESN